MTSNKHKFNEVAVIAEKLGICLEMLPGKKIEIQSSSLMDIAFYSALENYKEFRKPILVEDAGLFIEALNGFPGPYSSYVYKTIGVKGILKLMEGIENRRAYFSSAVVLIHEPYLIKCEERVYGYISNEPRGTGGFGFDPIFVPEGDTRTFAEMSIDEKNKYSHRAKAVSKAFNKLISLLKT
ncbi:XTP/dITP diphosphatase [Desulfurococcaceae archaeon MEX13E-LK6-19]|nr:XTP/dITP diphosphatase [Desulfurococcaceae archaeon MEX13E-LK6-19]